MMEQMTARVASLVKETMVGLPTPIQDDVLALTQGQKNMDKQVAQLRNEVRASLTALEGRVATLESSIAGLMKSFDNFAIRQDDDPRARQRSQAHPSAAQATSSSPSSRPPVRLPQRVDISALRYWSPDGRHDQQPEAVQTKMVCFLYPVIGDRMQVELKNIQSHYDEDDFWAAAIPNFPGGGAQFGIVFEDRRKATAFAAAFRTDTFRYTPTGAKRR